MENSDIDRGPTDGGLPVQSVAEPNPRQEWVRANFTRIFGLSAADLRARGINPRQYARDHRDKIRQFARDQRSQGIAVPGDLPRDGSPTPPGQRSVGAGRFGVGRRGGSAWIGILISLLALRFLLVDSFVGAHAAILWVVEIGGIMLVARVLLFSWLRQRRQNR